jgi:putative ABC transport system ATP-binding protein
MIVTKSISKAYNSLSGRQHVLVDVDLSVAAGEMVAVTGPSGCGKTTLLKLLAGMDRPDSGQVRVMDRDLAALSDLQRAQVRRDHIGYIFQKFSLLPFLDAAQNVELPLRIRNVGRREQWHPQVHDALAFVGLSHKAQARPRELSGGEQQRVAVARAFVAAPQILLCDEPTGSLNEEGADQVFELLLRLAKEFGRCVILVTHNERLAKSCDRTLRLQNGHLSM